VQVVEPGQSDPVIASLTESIGGPMGTHQSRRRSWLTPIRALLGMTTVAYVLGYVLDLSCVHDGWRSPENYQHLCYTDITPLYSMRGFADGLLPYLQAGPDGQYLEYPVITGFFMQIAAVMTTGVSHVAGDLDRASIFFHANVVLLFIALLVTVLATALTVKRRPWDAAMVAVAPTMILAATINWDLLPLAFAGLALMLWSRDRALAAGLLLGLAVAAKFYPLLFLGAFLVLSLRSGRWRSFGLLFMGTGISWLAVNIPIMFVNFDGWSFFYRFSGYRGEDFGSIWFGFTESGLGSVPADSLNLASSGLFLILCAGIALLVLNAPRRPRLASVLFLIIAAFAITNKVYSPQYSLWLIPLAVLAHPKWRDFLIWQAGEVIYFLGIWWFLVGYGIDGQKSLTGQQYAIVIFIHVLATAYLAFRVIQAMYVPTYDPVRSDGFADDSDDPGGGAYNNAPDVFTLRSSRGRHRVDVPSDVSQ